MKTYILLCSLSFVMLASICACSISNDYCCTSNDQCKTTPKGLHSCSNDKCGKCLLVEPLAISTQTLTEAALGQTDYSVEITGSGGIPPYTWAITKGDEKKLSWLDITPEGDTKALLQNLTDTNNALLYPTEISYVVPLTITLMDSSRHGKDTRPDNQGVNISETITIIDCSDNSCEVCNSKSSKCSPFASIACNQDSETIQGCWYDSDGCSEWKDQGIYCSSVIQDTCKVSSDGSVTCNCVSGSTGEKCDQCQNNDACIMSASCVTNATTGKNYCSRWANPLEISLSNGWQDATVGVPYSIEFVAKGGFPPYTWILNGGNTISYPAWLSLDGEEDNSKATLHNIEGQLPSAVASIPIKVTVIDSSIHGNRIRNDNQGVSITETLTVSNP